jgi:hypothetical protein
VLSFVLSSVLSSRLRAQGISGRAKCFLPS